MAPRKTELPEGTDHVINGAMERKSSAGSGTGGGRSAAGGSGFIGGSQTVAGDDTGGAVTGGGGRRGGGGGGRGPTGGGGGSGPDGGNGSGRQRAVSQLKDGANDLRRQATTKVREYAEDGKSRATTALDDFSGVIRETADQIDERLGPDYGQYARRAADAVSDFSQNIGSKTVDQLYDEARDVVRKSPVVAIGVAAAVGFALVRLVKAGLPEENDVEFEADPELGTGGTGTPPRVTPRAGA